MSRAHQTPRQDSWHLVVSRFTGSWAEMLQDNSSVTGPGRYPTRGPIGVNLFVLVGLLGLRLLLFLFYPAVCKLACSKHLSGQILIGGTAVQGGHCTGGSASMLVFYDLLN